jgi:NAD(P)-dependent dehydrogenase (short-subunit alcohol dehydrogenase family)
MSRQTWVVVGASRGIGLEFVSQLLSRGDDVLAAVRDLAAPRLSELLASHQGPGRCLVEQCDVSSEESIEGFVQRVEYHMKNGVQLGSVVLNAGILKYPNRASEM